MEKEKVLEDWKIEEYESRLSLAVRIREKLDNPSKLRMSADKTEMKNTYSDIMNEETIFYKYLKDVVQTPGVEFIEFTKTPSRKFLGICFPKKDNFGHKPVYIFYTKGCFVRYPYYENNFKYDLVLKKQFVLEVMHNFSVNIKLCRE